MAQPQTLYRLTLEEAVAGGGELMGKLVLSAGKVLHARELTAKTIYERDALLDQGKLLQSKQAELRAAFPKALQAVFYEAAADKTDAALPVVEVQFDQLELMDESEVHESVVLARAQQVTMMVVDASLVELTTLICSLQGLPTVRAERNPLRPESYVQALKTTVGQLNIANAMQLDWVTCMSAALGTELNAMYRSLAERLRGQGVVAVGYAVQTSASMSAPTSSAGTAVAAAPATRNKPQGVLTLDKLRRLLSGELETAAPHAVPAALESLALSLEVVALMVDNMARNPRLLPPVQRVIVGLEPALLRLSVVDPRFFIEKEHPARVLLQEVTNRSLAYESVQATGFAEFLATLESAVEPLARATVENAEPFSHVLAQLRQAWGLAAQDQRRAREDAVQALQHAEQRNLLADKIARGIENHPDSASVPPVVIDFLCGPWAQVVAQARIMGGASANAADKYQALISAMLWSAHPELTRKCIGKLTRLVPLLLATLREGLDTIRYPATKTSAFFEELMGLHQLAFRSAGKSPEVVVPSVAVVSTPAVRAHRSEGDDPWVAPEEARASNFMDCSELPEQQPTTLVVAELPLGLWVELLVNGQWVRTQLTWASPHSTLFLFTSVFGTPQSMTRRSMDKLVTAGHLRIVSGQTMVDGALDAVAQIALRNSVDIAI